MTDEQAQRVIEMWVGCYDVADIAVSTGLTPFEVRAEINRVEPPDHGQAFLIPPKKGNGVNLGRADIPNPWVKKWLRKT